MDKDKLKLLFDTLSDPKLFSSDVAAEEAGPIMPPALWGSYIGTIEA